MGRPDPGDTDPDRVEARTRLQAQLSGERLAEVLEQLARCPAGLDATLAKVIRMGVSGVRHYCACHSFSVCLLKYAGRDFDKGRADDTDSNLVLFRSLTIMLA